MSSFELRDRQPLCLGEVFPGLDWKLRKSRSYRRPRLGELTMYVACCLLTPSVAPLCAGQTTSRPQVLRSVGPQQNRDARIEAAIRREVGADRFSYAYNLVNLKNGTAPEVLVYMTGPDYCGSGGCTSFVFGERSGDYRLISRLSLTRRPIIVSSHRTNGWRDLIVFVAGGGIQPGHYAVLPFDGEKYPENPTTRPAVPLRRRVTGVAYLAGADNGLSDIVVSPR